MKTRTEQMDASQVFCPNLDCMARGKVGQGTLEQAQALLSAAHAGTAFNKVAAVNQLYGTNVYAVGRVGGSRLKL